MHYSRLIERARTRELPGYCERHHVIPRCIGGSDDPSNIVRLTPEEHYVAHQLLVKIYPTNAGLAFAAVAMTAGRSGNKLYGWLRRRASAAAKGNQRCLGRRHSAETKAKMSAASKGKAKSAEHRAAMSVSRTGKTPNRGDKWRANQAAAMRRIANTIDRSHMQSAEWRAAQSARMKQWHADRRAALAE
jgi:hypothetical protein